MLWRLAFPLLTALALAATPSAAAAQSLGTVTAGTDGTTLTVVGGPEDDQFQVVFLFGGVRVSSNSGATAAGPGCVADGGAVTCADAGYTNVLIDGGGGDDQIRTVEGSSTKVPTLVLGGAGADRLTGGFGGATYNGGDGDDVLRLMRPALYLGGAGRDLATLTDDTLPAEISLDGVANDRVSGNQGLNVGSDIEALKTGLRIDVLSAPLADGPVSFDAGPGDDTVTGSPFADRFRTGAGADVYRGEGGADLIDYDRGDTVSVFVRLDGKANDGTVGEKDNVIGVEQVLGGGGNDVFDGSISTASLRFAGRGGADSLIGGAAADLLEGGSGDDRIRGLGGKDRISCGTGKDTVLAGKGDEIPRTCESVQRRRLAG